MSKPCLVHEGALRGPYLPKLVGDVLCLRTRVTECLPTRRASERVVFRRGTADASGSAWSARARAGPHATVCLSQTSAEWRVWAQLLMAMRSTDASGWQDVNPHPPRAAGRPRGAARNAIRASITIVAWHAHGCLQITRRRPKPSRRRPASDAPARAPRPQPRCKTGRGCATDLQRQKDDNPTAGHKQPRDACGLSRRARRARSQRSSPPPRNELQSAAARRLSRLRPPATRRRRPGQCGSVRDVRHGAPADVPGSWGLPEG